MALISMRQLLDHAADHQYGIPAFNINNLEQIHAIMEAAYETNSPVIAQISTSAMLYAGPLFLKYLIMAAIEEYPSIPVCMHQDHGYSPAVCQRAIQLGCSSVMMDGSLAEDKVTPCSYQYNVRVTKIVTDIAHSCGVSVEGELGCLGSLENNTVNEKENNIISYNSFLTDPLEAKNFVDETKIDALAIAIGTKHGPYKFSRPPTEEVLVIDRIKEINKNIPNTHLVMHGASSVSKYLLNIINDNGGSISETYGVPVKEIQIGIKYGVRKINIDTDLRLAATGAIRSYMKQNPIEFDPRKYNRLAKDAMKEICIARFQDFGSAGYADKIKPISLAKMVNYYR